MLTEPVGATTWAIMFATVMTPPPEPPGLVFVASGVVDITVSLPMVIVTISPGRMLVS